jgi:hypothetical protein
MSGVEENKCEFMNAEVYHKFNENVYTTVTMKTDFRVNFLSTFVS